MVYVAPELIHRVLVADPSPTLEVVVVVVVVVVVADKVYFCQSFDWSLIPV
jgi:hypothetical protein